VDGTLLGERIDLRVWGSLGAGFVANDALVKTYLDRVGTEVRVNNVRHTYDLGANNVPVWNQQDTTQAAADITTFSAGWEANKDNSAHKPRVRREGNRVHLSGAVTRLTGDYTGILTVPAAYRPIDGATRFVGSGVTSNGISYQLALTNGVLWVPPGYASKSDTGAFTAVPVTATWPIA
jgi:predicted TIM-barrel enzyme